jgi:hypothetical protein
MLVFKKYSSESFHKIFIPLVFKFEFMFLSAIARRLPLGMLKTKTFRKCLKGYWQSSGKFLRGYEHLFANGMKRIA